MATKEEEFNLTKAGEILQKVAKPVISFITIVFPIIFNTSQSLYAFYLKLPIEGVKFLIGFIFCFFGGMYPTLFAAIQAAKHGGMKTVIASISDISSEVMIIVEESKKDDTKDDDNDGISDVDQIDGKALLLRKANLVLTKINPVKVRSKMVNRTHAFLVSPGFLFFQLHKKLDRYSHHVIEYCLGLSYCYT